MYRMDLAWVLVVAFGISPWRNLRSGIGALVWSSTVLFGVQLFLEWRFWYHSPSITSFIEPWAAQVGLFLQNRIDRIATGTLHSFLEGVLLGDRSGISSVFQEGFRDLGIAHMLAVSGFHVGFWVALGRPLKWIFRLRKVRLFYVLLMAFFFVSTA